MSFDLAAMTRRARNIRRASVTLRPIVPPATLATNLYRAVYLPVIREIEAAIPSILATYTRSLAELTTDAPADVRADLDGVSATLQRLILTLEPRLRDWIIRIEAWHRNRWRGAVLTASGVDLGTLIGPETARQTLEAAIEWNVNLLRDVGQQARQRISNAIFTGLSQRRAAREVAGDIREAVAMSRRRSIGIAADQLSKVTSALDAERMREAGLDRFQYRHSGKLHPREWHKARDGKIYELDTGKQVGGSDVIAPDDAPGIPPWCACRRQGIISFD